MSSSAGLWQPSAAQRTVVRQAAEAFGFGHLALINRGKKGRLPLARHAAVWAIKARWPALSWPQIAVLMGGRDHSTVIHSRRRAEEERDRDAIFREVTDALAGGRVPPPIPVPAELAERVPNRIRTGTARPRKVRSRNDFGDEDPARALGSDRLLAALRREHPERCAA